MEQSRTVVKRPLPFPITASRVSKLLQGVPHGPWRVDVPKFGGYLHTVRVENVADEQGRKNASVLLSEASDIARWSLETYTETLVLRKAMEALQEREARVRALLNDAEDVAAHNGFGECDAYQLTKDLREALDD